MSLYQTGSGLEMQSYVSYCYEHIVVALRARLLIGH